MEWIYVVVVAGSIATSGYPTEEACQGHKVVFDRDYKTVGVCVKMPSGMSYFSSVPQSFNLTVPQSFQAR